MHPLEVSIATSQHNREKFKLTRRHDERTNWEDYEVGVTVCVCVWSVDEGIRPAHMPQAAGSNRHVRSRGQARTHVVGGEKHLHVDKADGNGR